MDIHIRLARYRGVLYIYYRKGLCTALLREFKPRLRVSGFAALGHDYYKISLSDYRIHVAELRRDLHGNGNPRQLLNCVPRNDSGVHCRSARNYENALDIAQHIISQTDILKIWYSIAAAGLHRFRNDPRLLVYLL